MIARSCRTVRRRIAANAIAISVLLASLAVAGCHSRTPTAPSSSAVATIRVVNELFRVLLTDEAQVAAARAAMAGGPARIPAGRIVGGTQVNVGYSWHLENVKFVEATIELCDGRPSMVESQGTAFGGGQFCPWSAVVVSIAPQ